MVTLHSSLHSPVQKVLGCCSWLPRPTLTYLRTPERHWHPGSYLRPLLQLVNKYCNQNITVSIPFLQYRPGFLISIFCPNQKIMFHNLLWLSSYILVEPSINLMSAASTLETTRALKALLHTGYFRGHSRVTLQLLRDFRHQEKFKQKLAV